jgi:hypothetical protein
MSEKDKVVITETIGGKMGKNQDTIKSIEGDFTLLIDKLAELKNSGQLFLPVKARCIAVLFTMVEKAYAYYAVYVAGIK